MKKTRYFCTFIDYFILTISNYCYKSLILYKYLNINCNNDILVALRLALLANKKVKLHFFVQYEY